MSHAPEEMLKRKTTRAFGRAEAMETRAEVLPRGADWMVHRGWGCEFKTKRARWETIFLTLMHGVESGQISSPGRAWIIEYRSSNLARRKISSIFFSAYALLTCVLLYRQRATLSPIDMCPFAVYLLLPRKLIIFYFLCILYSFLRNLD